jgi:putative NADPH-quinone reductase
VLKPGLGNIKKAAFVTTYGGDRWRTFLMGDPPRRIAMRWGWVTFQTRPKYLALYDMNNVTQEQRVAFLEKVQAEMGQF